MADIDLTQLTIEQLFGYIRDLEENNRAMRMRLVKLEGVGAPPEPKHNGVVSEEPVAATVVVGRAAARIIAHAAARSMGFEGDACPECGAMTMTRNGSCLKCESCGATTGCS